MFNNPIVLLGSSTKKSGVPAHSVGRATLFERILRGATVHISEDFKSTLTLGFAPDYPVLLLGLWAWALTTDWRLRRAFYPHIPS